MSHRTKNEVKNLVDITNFLNQDGRQC